jgi:hypothetical protein
MTGLPLVDVTGSSVVRTEPGTPAAEIQETVLRFFEADSQGAGWGRPVRAAVVFDAPGMGDGGLMLADDAELHPVFWYQPMALLDAWSFTPEINLRRILTPGNEAYPVAGLVLTVEALHRELHPTTGVVRAARDMRLGYFAGVDHTLLQLVRWRDDNTPPALVDPSTDEWATLGSLVMLLQRVAHRLHLGGEACRARLQRGT